MPTLISFAKNYLLCFLLYQFSNSVKAQNMDDKIKTLANEIADQAVKNGIKKVAVTTLDYKGCSTEFGKFLTEELTGNLSISGRAITVVNQKMLESLLVQNKLTAKGLLEARNDAAKLGQVSGIDALVYGTITTLGEDIRISLNVVRLPTLAVFGYAKSVFSLTTGIKNMLTCLTETNVPQSSELTDEPTAIKTPKPSADCGAKHTCVVCATNKLAINVKANIGWWGPDLYIHPSETKCWQDVPVGNGDYYDRHVRYRDDNNTVLKIDEFVVESCKTYSRSLVK